MTVIPWIVVFLVAPGILGHSCSGDDAGNAAVKKENCIKREGENIASTTDAFDGVSLLTVSTRLAHRDGVVQKAAPQKRSDCDIPRCKACTPPDSPPEIQRHAAGLVGIPGRAWLRGSDECYETYEWHDPLKKVLSCHRKPQWGACFGAACASLSISKSVCRSCQCSFEDFAVDVTVQVNAKQLQVNANKDETFHTFKTRISAWAGQDLGIPRDLVQIFFADNQMADDDTLQQAGVSQGAILVAMIGHGCAFLGTFNLGTFNPTGTVRWQMYAIGASLHLYYPWDGSAAEGKRAWTFSKSQLSKGCQAWMSRKDANPQSPSETKFPYTTKHYTREPYTFIVSIDDHDSNKLCREERAKWDDEVL